MSSPFSIESAQEKAIDSQLVLKRLPITKYAKNVIKDFIFVDSESFVHRAVVKTQRVNVNKQISGMIYLFRIMTEFDSIITFTVVGDRFTRRPWFCNICGNYSLFINGNILISTLQPNDNLYCTCRHH
jgi:hypothetical protein